MDKLNGYELMELLKFWSNRFEPNHQTAERILQLATALKARVESESSK